MTGAAVLISDAPRKHSDLRSRLRREFGRPDGQRREVALAEVAFAPDVAGIGRR